MRRHPGTRFALRSGDFRIRHHRGDLAAHRDGIRAPLQGCKIEPFVGRDEVYHAGAATRTADTAFEQHFRIAPDPNRRQRRSVPDSSLTKPSNGSFDEFGQSS